MYHLEIKEICWHLIRINVPQLVSVNANANSTDAVATDCLISGAVH